jgi:flagellar hook-basal body complex protein FliE
MNTYQMNQLLAQMRAMAAQASAAPTVKPEAEAVPAPSFADVLKDAVVSVNRMQNESGQKADAFLRGEDVSLTEVMVAMQKARVGFEAVKQVRNRLLEAYQEISRMQI